MVDPIGEEFLNTLLGVAYNATKPLAILRRLMPNAY
jgi:hypothetical protein